MSLQINVWSNALQFHGTINQQEEERKKEMKKDENYAHVISFTLNPNQHFSTFFGNVDKV